MSNNRNENHNVNTISDFRVAPHASIDSNIMPERSSIDIFCDVSQEEWKENSEKKKSDKNQISKMIKWGEEKWNYIKIHWRAALVIGGVFLILIGLFITAVLLLTLLPRKNDSVESNNITPGPETTKAPESPHGLGTIQSMRIKSYQFKNNISVINSIVMDPNQNLLILADNQIMLLNIENKTLIHSSFSTECNGCKVYKVLPECFNDKQCKSESIFYCCQDCLKDSKVPICWNFNNAYQFDKGMIIKNGVYNHDNKNFQAEIIQVDKFNCQIQMFTFCANSNCTTSNSIVGESQKCTENPNFFVKSNLIAASARKNDTNFQWRANIDFNGTLKLYHSDASTFFIYNFVNSSAANKTLLKMKYNGINSFFVAALSDLKFISIAKITDDGITKKLRILQPLPFKIDISLGVLVDWDFYGEELSVWYFENNNRIYDLKVAFEWEDFQK